MTQAADGAPFSVDETVHDLEESLRVLERAVARLPESLHRATPGPRHLFEEDRGARRRTWRT